MNFDPAASFLVPLRTDQIRWFMATARQRESHYWKQGVHWSLTPDLRAGVGAKIHPDPLVKSWLKYVGYSTSCGPYGSGGAAASRRPSDHPRIASRAGFMTDP